MYLLKFQIQSLKGRPRYSDYISLHISHFLKKKENCWGCSVIPVHLWKMKAIKFLQSAKFIPVWFLFIFFFFQKTRLGNPEVRKVVDQSVQEHLTDYLELHPDILDSILSKSLNALKVLFLKLAGVGFDFLCRKNLINCSPACASFGRSLQYFLKVIFLLHVQAALAAKRARELVRQKSVLKSSSLPGKLADCSATNPEESGIWTCYSHQMSH